MPGVTLRIAPGHMAYTMVMFKNPGILRITVAGHTMQPGAVRKQRYLSRHAPREDWDNPMTAGALSRWVLWNKETLHDSIVDYMHRFDIALV